LTTVYFLNNYSTKNNPLFPFWKKGVIFTIKLLE
jgi:hypothetical protein